MTDDVSLLPLLVVQTGPLQGASFRLRDETCVIGRDEGVDVLVENIQVSRRHAVIERTGDGLTLADAGSTNGTWLNDRRLTDPEQLRDGDRIRVGGVELRFYDPASASTERVGAAVLGVLQREAPAAGAAAPTDALFGPTQVMDTGPRRSGIVWLALTGLVLVLAVVGVIWLLLLR
jgi:pSer/pThr/pTyr-binding forkhead associated (FHA) protein